MMRMPINNRGITKAKLRHPEAAIPDFEEAIRLNPNDAKPYANRGNVKRELGFADDAKRNYQTALGLAEKTGDEELKSQIMKRLESL